MSNQPRVDNLRAKRTFTFDRIPVTPKGGVNDTWCIDLVDVETAKAPNSNQPMKAGYILSCVDLFSRFGWTVRINGKDAASVQYALKKCFEKFKGYPKFIWSDKEGCLGDADMKQWFERLGIKLYHTANSYSGINHYSVPIVESFNRTVKNHWDRIKNDNPLQSWQTVANRTATEFPLYYNQKIHSSLGVTPSQAFFNNGKKQSIMRTQQMAAFRPAPKTDPIKKGKMVYLQRQNDSAGGSENKAKKFDNTYIDKPFNIKRIVKTNPIRYELEGRKGMYYRKQLLESKKKN